jgi:hypothetical protein
VAGDLSTVWRISPVTVPHFLALSGGVLRDLWQVRPRHYHEIKTVRPRHSRAALYDCCITPQHS